MDKNTRIKILKQLVKTSGDVAETALSNEALKVEKVLESESRYDQLKEQLEVLSEFVFRVPNQSIQIIENFLDRLNTLELKHDNLLNLPVDELSKFESKDDLIKICLDLLVRLRFLEPEKVLTIVVKFCRDDNLIVSEHALSTLELFARYDIDIHYSGEHRAGLGYQPQLNILEWIELLNPSAMKRNCRALTELCDHLLSPNMTGTSTDYRSITWHRASVRVNEELKSIRSRALKTLKRLFDVAENVGQKISIINAMLQATRGPLTVYNEDLARLINENTIDILNYFESVVVSDELQVLQKIEHDVYWRYKNADAEEVKLKALEISKLLSGNGEYTIYKNLIGYEGVFGSWQDQPDDEKRFSEIDQIRTERAYKYADQIDSDNWEEWRSRIMKYSQIKSNDAATFPYFIKFLERFAESSPELAIEFLKQQSRQEFPFVTSMLIGLWKSKLKEQTHELILDWIKQDHQLAAIARLFYSNKNFDSEVLAILLKKGIARKDKVLLNTLIGVSATNYSLGGEDLVQTIMLPSIKTLSGVGDASWVNDFWLRKEAGTIVKDLDVDDRNILFEGLMPWNEIDYHVEDILTPIAEDDPISVIKFFGERIEKEKNKKFGSSYKATPFKFYRLHKTLSQSPKEIVREVRKWYQENYPMAQYEGPYLLSRIFSDFSKEFETELRKLVESREIQSIEFVTFVLQNYEGQTFLYDICREIVIALPEDSEHLVQVESILLSTGVVTGEYGFAEAWEKKIEELTPWLDDKNKSVQKFADKFITELKESADRDRIRAKERLILRKHAWGDSSEEANNESDIQTNGDIRT